MSAEWSTLQGHCHYFLTSKKERKMTPYACLLKKELTVNPTLFHHEGDTHKCQGETSTDGRCVIADGSVQIYPHGLRPLAHDDWERPPLQQGASAGEYRARGGL